jgi:pilus assembly protein CpaE
LVILDPVERSRETLRSQFLGLPWIWLQAECTKYDFLQEVLHNQELPHIVVVSIDADLEKACMAISRLNQEMPQVGILAVSIRDDGQAILRALRSGAKEFLTLPCRVEELTEVLRRLERISIPNNGSSKSPSAPKVAPLTIAVLGSRGGVVAQAPR